MIDYNIEGYLSLNFSKKPLNDRNDEIICDHIEANELIESNQEYKYYFKYFYGHVN